MWYLGYVHGGKSRVAGANRWEFNEFIVERDLRALGLDCWCGRRMEFKRTGKQRRPEPQESPYLLNYIFADIPADLFFKALAVKHLAPTLLVLTDRDINGVERHRARSGDMVPAVTGLRQFREAVDGEYARACRIKDNQDLVSEYALGQELRYLEGGFADTLMRFKKMVERPGDMYPKIRVEADMMGSVITMDVDPLAVRAAE